MSDSYSYSQYLREINIPGKSTATSIFLSIFTNPLFVIKYIFTERKILYLLQLAIPLLVLPVFSGKKWILFIWGLGATFFGTIKPLTDICMQYTVFILPFLLFSIPSAINNLMNYSFIKSSNINPTKLKTALFGGMVAATISMSFLYGAFFPNASFRAGFEPFQRHTTKETAARYETVQKIDSMVPPNASVWATLRLCPHFSLRDYIWCLDRPKKPDRTVDYVITYEKDVKRKKRLERRSKRLKKIKESQNYKVIFEENDIRLYKRIK